jgi:hypothetical protein
MSDIQRIDFHGHDLYSLRDEQTGKEYVLPKRFTEILQLSWQGQLAKLTQNLLFKQGIKKIFIPSVSGAQETVLLELELLHAWLLSISPARVKEELRNTLLLYQRECAHALHEYWSKPPSTLLERALLDLTLRQQEFVGMVDARLGQKADKAEVREVDAKVLQGDENLRLALERERDAREQCIKELAATHQREHEELKQQLEAIQTVASGPSVQQDIAVNTVRNFIWNAVGLAGHDQVQLTGGKRLKKFIDIFEAYMRLNYRCASQDPKARGDAQYEQPALQEAYETPGFGTTDESRKLSGHERMTVECEAFIAAMQNLRYKSDRPFPREVKSPRRYAPGTGEGKDSA